VKRSTLRFHVAARAELLEAHRFYWRQSPAAADGFLLELDRALDEIAEAPARWPRYVAGTRRLPLRRFPFLVIYLAREGSVTIVAIAHGRRKPGYWRKRVH